MENNTNPQGVPQPDVTVPTPTQAVQQPQPVSVPVQTTPADGAAVPVTVQPAVVAPQPASTEPLISPTAAPVQPTTQLDTPVEALPPPTSAAVVNAQPVMPQTISDPFQPDNPPVAPPESTGKGVGKTGLLGKFSGLIKNKRWLKSVLLIALAIFLIWALTLGAYKLGKGDKEIVIQERTAQPINLPAQAVVVADCVPGRGKQYILPENIPNGPIYDVVNSRVIAIEFTLSLQDIQSDPDNLPNTILKLVRDYPVDNFKLVPAPTKAGEALNNIHLILFIVPQSEATQITCEAPVAS